MKTFYLSIYSLFILLPLATKAKVPCEHNEIIVQLQPNSTAPELTRTLTVEWPNHGFKIRKLLSARLNCHLIELNCDMAEDFDLASLRKMRDVVAASWNRQTQFRKDPLKPNDPLFPSQWNMERIGLTMVWPYSQGGTTPGGKEIVVAVIDNGFDLFHPDLESNFWRNPNEEFNGQDDDGNGYIDDVYGWNFHDDSPLIPLSDDHAAGVSGLIGAIGDNGEGLAGVNWKVKIMPLHFLSPDEAFPAFEYALKMRELYNSTNGEKGAYIVATNGSFGISDPVDCSIEPYWSGYYDLLGKAGVLSVAATPNKDWNIDEVGDMPTSCPSEFLLTVTNTGPDDKKVISAGYGKTTIDLGAPGEQVPTTDINGGYDMTFQGTSAACPLVTGAISLLYSMPCPALEELVDEDPAAAARLVRDVILKNVEPLPSLAGITVTGGLLNVFNGMKYLHSYCIAKPEEREEGNFQEIYLGGRDFLQISPNPTADFLKVDFSIQEFRDIKFRVFNMLGQEVRFLEVQQAEPFEPQSFTVDVSDWAAGTYFINIFDLSRSISRKFVKH
ncbi:MAG: S8 family peptidase [Saprospiraceae bacterium]|nr:S8 family peptidase [Saprospiraceae bacterium]